MKIVKFDNGKYGLTRGWWFWREFLGVDTNTDVWWIVPEHWLRYCMFHTYREAEDRRLKYTQNTRLSWKDIE